MDMLAFRHAPHHAPHHAP